MAELKGPGAPVRPFPQSDGFGENTHQKPPDRRVAIRVVEIFWESM